MDEPLEGVETRAQKYAEACGLTIGPQLGSGRDGTIWRVNRQSRVSAIKVHERRKSYACERDAYLRLRMRKVEEICGLNVPVLLDCYFGGGTAEVKAKCKMQNANWKGERGRREKREATSIAAIGLHSISCGATMSSQLLACGEWKEP